MFFLFLLLLAAGLGLLAKSLYKRLDEINLVCEVAFDYEPASIKNLALVMGGLVLIGFGFYLEWESIDLMSSDSFLKFLAIFGVIVIALGIWLIISTCRRIIDKTSRSMAAIAFPRIFGFCLCVVGAVFVLFYRAHEQDEQVRRRDNEIAGLRASVNDLQSKLSDLS